MKSRARLTVNVAVTVPYQDADPAGVVWHGNYFRYFDTARVALLDRLDYGYSKMAESGYFWPIIDTRVRFIQAVRYDQVIDVEAALLEWEYRLKIGYVIRDQNGQRLTRGYTVQVAVESTTGELYLGAPEVLLNRIEKLTAGQ